MSLINDYYFQVLTDQRERELARLVEQNWQVRLALSGRERCWRRLLARRKQRIRTVAPDRPATAVVCQPMEVVDVQTARANTGRDNRPAVHSRAG
jgi:hypothetical protein